MSPSEAAVTLMPGVDREDAMKSTIHNIIFSGCLAAAGILGSSAVLAANADTARMLARQSGCLECHAVDKVKDAPAWRDVAAKYQGSPDAVAKLTHHITSGEQVKFKDGHVEDHKIVKSKDPAEIRNLVEWILSLPGGTKP
jgi:cytochrome c